MSEARIVVYGTDPTTGNLIPLPATTGGLAVNATIVGPVMSPSSQMGADTVAASAAMFTYSEVGGPPPSLGDVYLFNSRWGNSQCQLATKSARNGNVTLVNDFYNSSWEGGRFIFTLTAAANPVTLLFQEFVQPEGAGVYTTLLTSAALASGTTTIFRIGPTITPAANLSIQDYLPVQMRILATTTGAWTASLQGSFFN